ncbi:hypothetical protein BV22DRAFT_393667 [Leucogyrophana mollusca]|uniref:Uncharacterized protein n=1 Tax=Leucogyrophana mollusca TaxID=85980 RepID=A0ACB8BM91_9AGAM|nr:hypothetical protein BV22DRAFT_393667 [Leucogyrophana mollusca]
MDIVSSSPRSISPSNSSYYSCSSRGGSIAGLPCYSADSRASNNVAFSSSGTLAANAGLDNVTPSILAVPPRRAYSHQMSAYPQLILMASRTRSHSPPSTSPPASSSPQGLCPDSEACIPGDSSSPGSSGTQASSSDPISDPGTPIDGELCEGDSTAGSNLGDPAFPCDEHAPDHADGPCAKRLSDLLLAVIKGRNSHVYSEDEYDSGGDSKDGRSTHTLTENLPMDGTNSSAHRKVRRNEPTTQLPEDCIESHKNTEPSNYRDVTGRVLTKGFPATNALNPSGIARPEDISGSLLTTRSFGQVGDLTAPVKMTIRRLSTRQGHFQPLKRDRSLATDEHAHPTELPLKRHKLDRHASRESAISSTIRTTYQAKKPASLRRAESLRSQASTCDDSEGLDVTPHQVTTPRFKGIYSPRQTLRDPKYPPTVPVSPIPDTLAHVRSRTDPLERTLPGPAPCRPRPKQKIPPVPIIAPPPASNILSPLLHSSEDWADERIKVLLVKEADERGRDGFDVVRRGKQGTDEVNSRRSGSISSSDEEDDWEEESVSCSISVGENTPTPSLTKHRARTHWSRILGIRDSFRKEVVAWMLDALPAPPPEPLSSPPHSGRSDLYECSDLYDQLNTSPETRFHATYIFTRYFLKVVGGGLQYDEGADFEDEGQVADFEGSLSRKCGDILSAPVEDSDEVDQLDEDEEDEEDEEGIDADEGGEGADSTPVMLRKKVTHGEIVWDMWQEGRETITWDIAVGCLALSVKLHRDFLPPLNPVYASDFLELAPHGMSSEDLEVTQRDILSAFSFCLGSNTPQSFLDELWTALPTLRKVVKSVTGGWKVVQQEIWEKLFEALLEPDVLQFLISVLTAAALLDGLVVALARQYKTDADEKAGRRRCSYGALRSSSEGQEGPEAKAKMWQTHVRRAMRAIEDVVLDVKDILQISGRELEECRAWLSLVGYESE